MKIYERHFIILSIVMFAIATGLFVFALLFIKDTVKPSATPQKPDIVKVPYFVIVDINELCRVEVEERKWENIVLHHSATDEGNAHNFDEYHRETMKWEHGLAYHFVIGNGKGSGTGEIEVGNRWKEQIHGAHTTRMDLNRVSIGICLVGNFEEDNKPTENQFESMVILVNYLTKRYKIPKSNIIKHNQVRKKHTACPGKNFPYKELLEEID